MIKFLAIQHTYKTVEFALFAQTKQIAFSSVDKIHASKYFLHAINSLLKNSNLSMADLSFIAVNQGPGPFTTMRVVIASVNGVAYATGLPLVGVDGLAAFLDEYSTPLFPSTVAFLNAYHHDVYFGVTQNGVRNIGCAPAQAWLTEYASSSQGKVNFIGNAVSLYRSDIQQLLGERAHIALDIPEYPSLTSIAQSALTQWHAQETTHQLFPLYLKKYSAVMPS